MSPGAPSPRTSWFRMTFTTSSLMGDPRSADRVRQQGHLASVLDRGGHVTLVLRAVAGDSAGADLAPVAHELPEQVHVLVVDVVLLVRTELAELALWLARETPALGHAVRPPPGPGRLPADPGTSTF